MYQLVSRRRFLKLPAQAAVGVMVASRPTAARSVVALPPESDAGALASLASRLVDPPHAAKPMTRWWWFGGAVTPAEITRELTFMRDAGLRGAEIQPVYPVELDDPSLNIRNHRYFSPEWFDAVRHAVREARRLGLQLDLTLGSGWPYGGPFIPTALSARRLRVLTQDVIGPIDVFWNVGPLLTGDDRVVAVVAVPMGADATPGVSRARVLEKQPRPVRAGDAQVGTAVHEWSVPAGQWRIMLFLDSPTGMLVKRPTYGMEGPVLDHHSRAATELFLRSAGDRVLEGIRDLAAGRDPQAPFTSIFCDSLEVYGADWTARLTEEFAKRRGYDLNPYLPALFHDVGPQTPHVRYDYHLTLSDLIIDDFFAPLVAWAEKRGMTARIQAHGAMGDVMRGYGMAHVPEGESIFLGDRYGVNLKHRRLASSAAHLYERPIVSAETYTWLRTPMFMTTLEQMKAVTDAMFLDGINQIVNHGYAYSPPEAGEPGWCFYASTEINHTNTWWRHYPHLARYVQRASALLREGISVNPVGVYLPVADVYADVGAGGLHIDVEVERHVDPALLNGLRHAGYDFDLLNDHALATRANVARAELAIGSGRYRVVVVPAVRWMPPESAERLAEFARAGGHLILVGDIPQGAPGVTNRESRSAVVRRSFEDVPRIPAGSSAATATAVVVPDVSAALTRLEHAMSPDFRIVHASTPQALKVATENVGFTHRRIGELDLYLVANISSEPQDVRAQFDAGHRMPQRWNLEQGTIEGAPPCEFTVTNRGRRVAIVELRLDPFESCAIVFGPEARARPVVAFTDPRARWMVTQSEGRATVMLLAPQAGSFIMHTAAGRERRVVVSRMPAPVLVEGPWRVSLGSQPPTSIQRLEPWTDLPAGKGFSGWGVYETEVEVPDVGGDIEWVIELGVVHETAEVSLNGHGLGAAWKGRRQLSCGRWLTKGRNRLRIEVANLWIHHVRAHPPGDPERRVRGVGAYPALAETAGIRWGTYGEVEPDSVPPSGLLGPVRLVPFRRVSIRL